MQQDERGNDSAVNDAGEQLLSAAVTNQLDTARELLAASPGLRASNIWIACACGESDTVAHLIKENPSLANRIGGERNWEPLLYACFSHLHKLGPRQALGIQECARLLLEYGVDPNLYWTDENWPDARRTALYGSTGHGNHAGLAKLLLKAGADPNDDESLHHAAEHMFAECLEVLAEHKADLSRKSPLWKNTPLYFVLGHQDNHTRFATAQQGARWLIEHGADPNTPCGEDSETALMLACRLGHDASLIELMLAKGADPALKRADGKTAWRLAARRGITTVTDLLTKHGALPEELTPAEQLIAVCYQSDEAAARRILNDNPGLVKQLLPEDLGLICEVAAEDNTRMLRLLLSCGWPVHQRGMAGGTPLHIACFHGWQMNAGVLLEAGADYEMPCERYGATPLFWAARGSRHCANPHGNYASTVTLLAQAGADLNAPNRWGEPMDPLATAEVQQVLEEQRELRGSNSSGR